MIYFICECGCGRKTSVPQRNSTRDGWEKGVPLRFIRGHNLRSRRGIRHTPEARRKMSLAKRGRPGVVSGEKHGGWKGDGAKYSALHAWVRRHKVKTGRCSTCPHTGNTEWANISGMYFRDLDDYAEMCQPCHHEFDAFSKEVA